VDRSVLPGGYVIAASHVIKFTSVDDDPRAIVREAQLQAELVDVQEKLDTLQNARVRVGPAVTLMVFGFGGASVAAVAAITTHASVNDATNAHDEQRYRSMTYGFSGLAVAGLVMGVAGTVKLGRATAQRRENELKAGALANRLSAIRDELHFGVKLGAQQIQVGVQGSF
jgi:hypothetical protein